MANQNGTKYGFTGLFPIKTGEHSADLRTFLRSLDDKRRYPRGSPFSDVPIVHMARFAIIDGLAYQGFPAKLDTLKSQYLLFVCDFDGPSIDALIQALVRYIPTQVTAVWEHCVLFPGTQSRDRLAAYFEQCQLNTNLFLADQPEASVDDILRGLMCRRRLGEFIRQVQRKPRNATVLQRGFKRMWRRLQNDRPLAGDL
jgi:hypothetical protein